MFSYVFCTSILPIIYFMYLSSLFLFIFNDCSKSYPNYSRKPTELFPILEVPSTLWRMLRLQVWSPITSIPKEEHGKKKKKKGINCFYLFSSTLYTKWMFFPIFFFTSLNIMLNHLNFTYLFHSSFSELKISGVNR